MNADKYLRKIAKTNTKKLKATQTCMTNMLTLSIKPNKYLLTRMRQNMKNPKPKTK